MCVSHFCVPVCLTHTFLLIIKYKQRRQTYNNSARCITKYREHNNSIHPDLVCSPIIRHSVRKWSAELPSPRGYAASKLWMTASRFSPKLRRRSLTQSSCLVGTNLYVYLSHGAVEVQANQRGNAGRRNGRRMCGYDGRCRVCRPRHDQHLQAHDKNSFHCLLAPHKARLDTPFTTTNREAGARDKNLTLNTKR